MKLLCIHISTGSCRINVVVAQMNVRTAYHDMTCAYVAPGF
jgi:hypothetical protein